MKIITKTLFVIGAVLLLSAVGNDSMDNAYPLEKILMFITTGMFAIASGLCIERLTK